jgi:hypothetical protein
MARQYEEAIAAFSRSTIMPYWARAYLAAACALAGRPGEAERHAEEVLRLFPTYTITRDAVREPFKRPSDREHLMDGLRKAGLPD